MTAPTPLTDGGGAEFSVERVTLNDTRLSAAKAVSVVLRVRNIGDKTGTYKADLLIDNESVDSASVALGGGANGTMVLKHRFEQRGVYQVSVNGLSLGNVSVLRRNVRQGPMTRPGGESTSGTAVGPMPPLGQGPIEIVDVTLPSEAMTSRSDNFLWVNLRNPANRTASRQLTVRVNGRPVANQTVRLDGGERAVVRVGVETRNGTVTVDGIEASRIRTGEPPDNTDGPAGLAGLLGPRLVLAGAILGAAGVVLGAAVLLTRQAG
jgi:hypothetical protein